MKHFQQGLIYILIIICILVEFLCVFNLQSKTVTSGTITFIFIACGLSISLLPFSMHSFGIHSQGKGRHLLAVLSFLAMFYIFYHNYFLFDYLFENTPISKNDADMLPAISGCIDRLFKGEELFAPQPEVWGWRPLYFPAFWLPYIPFKYFHYDMRWANYFSVCIEGILLWVFIFQNQKSGLVHKFFCSVLLLLGLYTVFNDRSYLLYTEEACVLIYFSILLFGLAGPNRFFTIIGFTLTLLSRYMHILWLPIWFASFWFKSKKETIRTALSVASLIVVTFGYFIVRYAKEFAKIPSIHNEVNLRHIREGHYHLPDPDFFDLGLSKYYTNRFIHVQPKLQLAICFLLTLVAIVYITLNRAKFLKKTFASLFSIAALKMMIVFFLSFLIIPYTYLFYTSLFISLTYFIMMPNLRLNPHQNS